MKFHWLTKFILCLGVALLPHAIAQSVKSGPADQAGAARQFDYSNQRPVGVPEPLPYDASGPIGMHHRIVETERVGKSPTGEKVTEPSSYTLLSVGMNYLDETGWHETKEAFTLTPNGAVALGAHKVLLAPDIHSVGSVSLTSPEGYPFRGHPAFLAYTDLNTHQMAVVAETTSSIGVQVAENQILYPSAFFGVKGDIRYTFSRSSFEQDVILREQIPGPEEFGLGTESVLQAWFEVVESAIPTVEEQDIPTKTQTFVDERLKFGSLQFVHGRAFSLADDQGLNAEKESVPVVKSWMNVGGRQFLVESIHSPQLQPLLQALPAKKEAKNNVRPKGGRNFDVKKMAYLLPAMLLANKTSNEVLMAKADLKRQPGVVLDYSTVVTASGVRFYGTNTYLITNAVILSGESILEGGSVLKFQDTNSSISLSGPLTCLTSPTRPAILTAMRDDTVGQTIGSGAVSGYYGNPALRFDYTNAACLANFDNVFVRYAKVGAHFRGGVWHQVWNSQFVNCEKAVQADSGSDISYHNVLFVNSGEVFGGTGATNRGENITVNQASSFNSTNAHTIFLTNSLLFMATAPGSYSGANNANTVATPFQTVGAGSSYLADNSSYRNAGTTNNVNARLLANLAKRTTYPPIALPSTISADLTLSAIVPRDTNAPDLGFHFWPLDYVAGDLNLTNATLLLTNGVSIGYYGAAGFNLLSGGKLISAGSPNAHNLLVRYSAIQDQPNAWGSATTTLINGPSSASVKPVVQMRFTDLTISASARISDNYFPLNGSAIGLISLNDCQLQGGTVTASSPGSGASICGLTNNLFQQCVVNFQQGSSLALVVKVRNNLFINGSVSFDPGNAISGWEAYDNLFDNVATTNTYGFNCDYNGYVNSSVLGTAISPTHNQILSPFKYVTGPLGDYYLPSNSPLINAGSTSATNVGLFHYTTQWDQTKEADSAIDIGYHYIAVQDGGYTASSGFSGVQGKNNWYYNYTSTLQGLPTTAMEVYYAPWLWWHFTGDFNLAVWTTGQHTGGGDSVRPWVAPRAGTITINSTAINYQSDGGNPTNRDGTLGRVLQNSTALIGWTTFAVSNLVTMNTNATVQAGDQIHFQLNRNANSAYDATTWDPTIAYTDGTVYSALTGFSGTQGGNNWYYRFASLGKGPADGFMQVYTTSPWNQWNKDTSHTLCAVYADGGHPDVPMDSIRTFKAPVAGRVSITSQVSNNGGGGSGADGTYVRIMRNTLPLTDWTLAPTNGTTVPLNVNATVQAGDELHFQLNRNSSTYYDNTFWSPTITYLASAISDAPRDSNGDGIVDYIADANGNGILDAGERVVLRPVLTFASSTTNYTERATPVAVDSGALVALPGATTLGVGKLTFQIVSGANANDRLMITNQGSSGGQIGYNSANGIVTYQGDSLGNAYGGTNGAPLVVNITTNGTPAAIQALVRRIIFDNRSHNPGNASRVVQAVLTDGVGASSLPAVKTIAFTVIDEPPILRLSSGQTQVVKGGSPELVDPAGRIDDPDTADFNGGTLKVSVPSAASLDLLSVRHNGSNAGQIGVLPTYSGGVTTYTATYGGVPFGTITGGNGTNVLRVDLGVGVTPVPLDAVGALIRSIQYQAGATATNNSTQSVYFQVFEPAGYPYFSSNLFKLVKILPASQTNGVGGGGDIPVVGINTGVTLHGAFSTSGGSTNVHFWWSKVSGPGTVSFVPADALDTTAYFSTNGMYVVRITANTDGSGAVQSQDFTVRVTDGTITSPLRVSAGQPFEVILPSGQTSISVQLQGLVSGATNTTVIRWSDTNQTGVSFSSVTNPAATVTFTQVGKYAFTLTASSTTDTNADTTTVTVCRQEEAPVDIMLIVDHSLSMLSSNRIQEVKAAVTTFCELLNFSKHQVGVVSFGTTAGIELSLNQDREKTIRSVHALHPSPNSGSMLELGLPLAVQELIGPRANPAASPIVIVFSDGGVSSSQEVTNAAEQAKLAGIRIMTVGINPDGTYDAAVMKGVASSTNDYFESSSPTQLISLMAGISRSFCYLPNMRPLVYAGPDQSFRVNQSAHLSGLVRTDAATHVTNCWNVVVGNSADVSFGTNNDPQTLVTFKVSTNYTLRLTTTDTSNGSNYWDEVNFLISENSPPTIRDGFFIVDAGSTNNSIPVLNTVIDPDGDPLRITSASLSSPDSGTATVASDGKRVLFTPAVKAAGTTHTIHSYVTDGKIPYPTLVSTYVFVRPEPLNFAPIAGDDTFYITNSTTDMVLNVLRNDYDPDDFPMNPSDEAETRRPLQIVNLTQPVSPYTNAVRIVDDGVGGTSLRYVVTSNPPTNTTLAFTYQVSDRYGATSSNANVTLHFYSTDQSNSPPVITGLSVVTQQFNNPTVYVLPLSVTDDGFPITGGAPAPITYSWSVDRSDGLDFYDSSWTNKPNPEVIFNQTGQYVFTLVASDGDKSTTSTFTNKVTENTLVAKITNIPDETRITQGRIALEATARDSGPIHGANYVFNLYEYGSSTVVWTYPDYGLTYTDGTTNISSTVDFTRLRNGIYTLELAVSKGGATVRDQRKILLDSNVKIGQLSFTVQDLAIPVQGIPITLTRTYDSQNPNGGSFGAGWTYALCDIDAQFDEVRDNGAIDGNGEVYSRRTGGGRNLVLTLPDGRRSAFQFAPVARGYVRGYYAEWQATGGVYAKLTPHGNDYIATVPFLEPYWQATGPGVSLDQYDMPGFDLTLPDGTVMVIERVDGGEHLMDLEGIYLHTYQNAHVAQVRRPNGATLDINQNGVSHRLGTNQSGAAIWFVRDSAGHITEVRDPRSGPGTDQPPVLKYVYDTNNNLTKVIKLVSPLNSTARYETNQYFYTNAAFPHLITLMLDARGVTNAVNEYYGSGDPDNGKPGTLKSITDARSVSNSFVHHMFPDGSGYEQVTRTEGSLSAATMNSYDANGNVTGVIPPTGNTIIRKYDSFNNLTSESRGDNPGLYGELTTYFQHGTNGTVTRITKRIGSSPVIYLDTAQSFNSFGQVTEVIEPNGNADPDHPDTRYATRQEFDGLGNLTKVVDGLTNATSYGYNALQLVESETNAVGVITRFTYDALGYLASQATYTNGTTLQSLVTYETDANGNRLSETVYKSRLNPAVSGGLILESFTTRYQYDYQNRLVATIDALGNTNSTIYNALGKVGQTTDALGHSTYYYYDPVGDLVGTSYADGAQALTFRGVITLSGSDYYRVVVTEDPHKGTEPKIGTRSYLDSLGRVYQTERLTNLVINVATNGEVWTTTFGSAGAVPGTLTTTVYDNAGRVLSVADPLGVITGYEYDSANRRVNATQTNSVTGDTLRSHTEYDLTGNAVATWQVGTNGIAGPVTQQLFDSLNRVTNSFLVQSNGSYMTLRSTVYDALGRKQWEADGDGIASGFQYDGLGHLIAVTNAVGTALQSTNFYLVDEMGGLLVQQDAAGKQTRSEFDGLGRRYSRMLPHGETEYWLYNGDGTVKQHQDFNGTNVVQTYDERGRLLTKKKVGDANPYVTFSYNGNSQRLSMSDGTLTTSYTYDEMGRLKTKSMPAGVLTYAYNGKGQVTNAVSSSSSGYAVGYGYDGFGRLSTVTANSQTSTYSYDPWSRLLSQANSPFTQSYGYNGFGQLTTQMFQNGGTVELMFSNVTYSAGGRRMGQNELITSHATRNILWNYDMLGRLISETFTNVSSTPGGTITYNSGSGYDLVGNRQQRTSSVSGISTVSSTYYGNDQVNPDGYDPNGNTIGQGSNSYKYDLENRLTNVVISGVTIAIVYGGDGTRLKKTSGSTVTWYLVDDQTPTGYAQVVEEKSTTNGSPNVIYVYGSRLISHTQSGTTYYYASDIQGSTRAVYASSGTRLVAFSYDAFGNVVDTDGSSSPSISRRFNTEEWDFDLSLYNLRARTFNIDLGRFMNRDNVEGSPEDPASLHQYLYCRADPVNRIDPSGQNDFSSPGQLATGNIMGTLSGQVGVTIARANLFAFQAITKGTTLFEAYEGYIALGSLLAPVVLDGVIRLAENNEPVPAGNFPRGRFAERVYGANLGGNFPVIDDWRPELGQATALRTHALASPAAYKNTVLNDIFEVKNGIKNDLFGYADSELGGGGRYFIPKADIRTAVLMEIIPEAETELFQSKAIMSSIRAAAGNLKVVFAPMKGFRR